MSILDVTQTTQFIPFVYYGWRELTAIKLNIFVKQMLIQTNCYIEAFNE